MREDYQSFVLYIRNGIEPEEFWQRFWQLIPPQGRKTKLYMYDIDGESHYLPRNLTDDELLRYLERGFVSSRVEFLVFLDWPDWRAEFYPQVIHLSEESPWQYRLTIEISPYELLLQEKDTYKMVINFCKQAFLEFPSDFAFACHNYLDLRNTELLCNEKMLSFIPTLAVGAEEKDVEAFQKKQFEVFCQLFPHLGSVTQIDTPGGWHWFIHIFPLYLVHTSPYWCQVQPPAWFYLLSYNYYEASKPYLPNLPVEAIERFPGLQGYGVQKIEELENGGAFILLGYPHQFDEL